MRNCLNIPVPVLEAMLQIAWEFMDPDEYRENIGGTNWLNPAEAGPAWQEVKSCFERVASKSHLPRPKQAVKDIMPILTAHNLTLTGNQIIREAS